jgi:hypothetical protein
VPLASEVRETMQHPPFANFGKSNFGKVLGTSKLGTLVLPIDPERLNE